MMYRKLFVLLAFLLLITGQAAAQGENPVNEPSRYAGRADLPIPEFPADLEWINVDAPLSIQDLRGKIVLFDFWTYGCINCIHMIPVLHALEEKYADELVVIGVHSAKFENEGQTENIAQIVQRYDIVHPVINDRDFRVWSTYGVNAWPTFVVADPRGNVIAIQAGEVPFDAFDRLLTGMVDYFDSTGELNREPLAVSPEGARQPRSLLHYPGKVLADVEGNRLFIADSSNNRLIITNLGNYEVLDVIGTGSAGYTDGAFEEAQFDKPQGMALNGDVLYVADTNNHTIRAVNLNSRTVTTIAGTGTMGRGLTPFGVVIREPLIVDLRSPWDVELGADSTLYIAMAGTHQIWEMNLQNNTLRVSVGNGREAQLNTSLAESELAQPSGLYYTDGRLYFADSESSTVRVADYTTDSVEVVSGTLENSLFDFGDAEGAPGTSRLQHALGVDGDGQGTLYIADTYNSRIKVVNADGVTLNLLGQGGAGGFTDGDAATASFDEPGGLDYVSLPDGTSRLYIADTNNHAIRVVNLATNTVSTVSFPNPERLQIADQVTVIGGNRAQAEALVLPEQVVSAGEGAVVVRLTMPEGYKLNDLAQSRAEWRTNGSTITLPAESVLDNAEVRIPVTLAEGEGRLYGTLTVYFCEAVNESLCFIDEFSVEVPVSVGPQGGFEMDIVIERALVPPQIDSLGGIS
ncbi:MAG: hypothetical protein OHK0046_12110 [Anaerolineae bacterium]